MSSRALLIAATTAAAAGVFATDAHALAPLAMDASLDLSMTEPAAPPSPHAALTPRDFERAPDAAYEPTAYVADRRARLQCVPFAREEAGVEIYGNANTWWAQAEAAGYVRAEAPTEGAVIVLRGYATTRRGHVGVVREVVSERMIIVDHANWLNGGEITRNVPVRDVSPNNDWSQVQVWHVPGRQWGARTYSVQGFIENGVARALETAAPTTASAAANAAIG
ncbi:MAG: CHAP domain-containing protein [Hyphomonadaceae bacterium]|nr:CHAP domain-containing protein [Hyphomonadaceae bacterium]